MREFNVLCKETEELDVLSYGEILAEKSLTIIPALDLIFEDEIVATSIFATFIIGSIVADGKIDEAEYALLYPSLREFFGDNIDYESCKKIAKAFKAESKELKQYVDFMTDILGQLSDELKEDIITVCLLICAVDGKISLKEKMWIKQLIKE